MFSCTTMHMTHGIVVQYDVLYIVYLVNGYYQLEIGTNPVFRLKFNAKTMITIWYPTRIITSALK